MEERDTGSSAGDCRPAMTMSPLRRGHDEPHQDLEEQRCCPNLLLNITLTVFAIVSIIIITITILYFVFSQKGPTLSITNVVVTNPDNTRPKYQVSLNVNNANKRLGVDYQRDAKAFLLFEQRRVAMGKFLWLDQDAGDWNVITVELTGFDGPLPPQMEKSMESNDDTIPIALDLDMRLRVKITAARLETWVMRFNVACTFVVNALRNDTRVLSQECQTNFKQI